MTHCSWPARSRHSCLLTEEGCSSPPLVSLLPPWQHLYQVLGWPFSSSCLRQGGAPQRLVLGLFLTLQSFQTWALSRPQLWTHTMCVLRTLTFSSQPWTLFDLHTYIFNCLSDTSTGIFYLMSKTKLMIFLPSPQSKQVKQNKTKHNNNKKMEQKSYAVA